jgi:hypothetical protein
LVLSSSVLAGADRAPNAGRDDTQEAWTLRSRFVDWNRLHNVGSPVPSRCPNMLAGRAHGHSVSEFLMKDIALFGLAVWLLADSVGTARTGRWQ